MAQSEKLGICAEQVGNPWKVLIRGEKHSDVGLSRVPLAQWDYFQVKKSIDRSKRLLQTSGEI